MSLHKLYKKMFEEMKQDIHFECILKKDDKTIDKIEMLCNCQCCPRHMSCKPEYDVFKLLHENTDKDEIEKLKQHVKHNIVFMGEESNKFNYSKSIFEMIEFINKHKEISEQNEGDFQQVLNTAISTFYNMIITFNDISEVKILCNIFEFKLMSLAMDNKFLQTDEKNKIENLEEVIKWGIDCYDNLKNIFYFQSTQIEVFKKGELNNYKNENLCTCNCRHFLRILLIRYIDSI